MMDEAGQETTLRWSWRESSEAIAFRCVFYVLGILLIISLVLPGPSRRRPGDLKKHAALSQIGGFTTALDLFNQENGRYPTTAEGLDALVNAPRGMTNWHQYLDSIPLDTWNHSYLYERPGKHWTNPYDLMSMGPDGVAGTEDDISNWKR